MSILNGIKIEGQDEVHQIDWDKVVANKPFSKTEGLQEIFPNQDVVFTYSGSTGYTATVKLDCAFSIRNNKTITVDYDGTEYSCKASATSSEVIFGNMAAVGGENTGEPFVGRILLNSDVCTMTLACFDTPEDTETPEAKTHSISIKYDTAIIDKIAREFVATDWDNNNMNSASYIKNKPFGTISPGDFVLPEREYVCESVETVTDGTTGYIAKASLGEAPFGMSDERCLDKSYMLTKGSEILDIQNIEDWYFEGHYSGITVNFDDSYVTWPITEEEYNSFNEGGVLTKTFGLMYSPTNDSSVDIPVPSRYIPGHTIELLYTNEDTSAEFAAQTISFDNNYSMYAIETVAAIGETHKTVAYVWAGHTITLDKVKVNSTFSSGGLTFTEKRYTRYVTAYENSIHFDSGMIFDYETNIVNPSDNTSVIPTKIYGIK